MVPLGLLVSPHPAKSENAQIPLLLLLESAVGGTVLMVKLIPPEENVKLLADTAGDDLRSKVTCADAESALKKRVTPRTPVAMPPRALNTGFKLLAFGAKVD